MKSIIELQEEILELNNKVKSLSSDITGLYNDMSLLKGQNMEDVYDFEEIEILSKHFPYTWHPICTLNDYAAEIYIKALMSIIFIDNDKDRNFNRLVFMQMILTAL